MSGNKKENLFAKLAQQNARATREDPAAAGASPPEDSPLPCPGRGSYGQAVLVPEEGRAGARQAGQSRLLPGQLLRPQNRPPGRR